MSQFENKSHPAAVWEKQQRDFTALFEKHFDTLVTLTKKYVKDLDAAKDIVQETLIRVWDNQSYLQIKQSVRSYLERACVNGALNYLRYHHKFFEEDATSCVLVNSDSPETAVTYLELHDNVMKFVQSLPEHLRSTFSMSRFQDMSYVEISKKLGVSVVAVEKRIIESPKRLRKYLTRMGLKLLVYFALSVELKSPRGTLAQQPNPVTFLSKRPDV